MADEEDGFFSVIAIQDNQDNQWFQIRFVNQNPVAPMEDRNVGDMIEIGL